ncbi:hypothetical protein ACFQ0B_36615 [Nonomuraea thailandensis]
MGDGKLPKLIDIPAFTQYIAQGWDSPPAPPTWSRARRRPPPPTGPGSPGRCPAGPSW